MAETKTIPMCSKCGNLPRAFPDSTNPWCKQCLTEYQAEYSATRKARDNGKGFTEGVESMRHALRSGLIAMHPSIMLRVKETLDWIDQFPAPRPQ